MQAYRVASGIIFDQHQQLLLVQNQRRNGSLDWSTPGGVVDPGEQVLEALQREVIEETSVVVTGWSPLIYTVEVDFVGRDMSLHAQVFQAQGYTGSLHVEDPDNVVVAGQWATTQEAQALLETSPQWVHEPLWHSLTNLDAKELGASEQAPALWKYRVTGKGAEFSVELVDFLG